MIARLLAWLFPPVLPGKVRDWHERIEPEFAEQGWAGNIQRRYTGIEKHWMTEKFYATQRQYHKQLRHAEVEIAALEQTLRDEGYINTIHDCWERTEEPLGTLQRLSLAGPPKK